MHNDQRHLDGCQNKRHDAPGTHAQCEHTISDANAGQEADERPKDSQIESAAQQAARVKRMVGENSVVHVANAVHIVDVVAVGLDDAAVDERGHPGQRRGVRQLDDERGSVRRVHSRPRGRVSRGAHSIGGVAALARHQLSRVRRQVH